MTDALAAYGTLLQRGDGADPEVFTTVAEVRNITNEATATVKTVTSMTSEDGFQEKIPTTIDPGEYTFSVNWVATHATHDGTTGLRQAMNDREIGNWKMVFPTSPPVEDEFLAFISKIGQTLNVDDEIQGSITLTITGKVTYG